MIHFLQKSSMIQKIVSTAFRDFKVFRLNLLRALSSSRPHQALNNPLRNMEDQTRTNPGCPPPPLSPSLFTPSSPTHPPISPSLSPLYRKNPSSSPDSPPSPPGSSCQACTFLLPPAGLQVGAGWGHLHSLLITRHPTSCTAAAPLVSRPSHCAGSS